MEVCVCMCDRERKRDREVNLKKPTNYKKTKTLYILSDKSVKQISQYMHQCLSRWVITVLFLPITRTLRGTEPDCMLITT